MRTYLNTLGFDDARLVEAGLMAVPEGATEARPRFRGRLIFPILLLHPLTFLESRALSPILIVTGIIVLLVIAIPLRKAASRSSAIRSW